MTRVLVVDDTERTRTVVGDALAEAGHDVETATSGQDALEATAASDLDVVVMAAELPDMNGLEALDRIMTTKPTLVLVLGAETGQEAAALEARDRGAVEVLPTPDGDAWTATDLATAVVTTVDELTTAAGATHALARATTTAAATRVGRVAGRPTGRTTGGSVAAGGLEAERPTSTRSTGVDTDGRGREHDDAGPVELDGEYAADPTVVVGASTGGPKVVERAFERLPADLGAKLVIVQHMPAGFTDRFARRLDDRGEYDVCEAGDGDVVGPGEAVVAPGDVHLEVTANVGGRIRVRFDRGDRIHGVRPSIDVTMESAARRVDDPLCGVVLSGMGRDGVAGIDAIDAAGGHTIAQDEATCPVFGIPSRAIETGAIDVVVPGTALAEAIVDAFETDGETDD